MHYNHEYANYVTEDGVSEIQALEKELGKYVLAYPTPQKPAALAPELIAKIESLEKKLCVRLVAYEKA